MNKRIFLVLFIIAVLVCTLTISASAQDRVSISYTDIDGVTHNVPVVKSEDATAQSVASALGNNATTQGRFIDNGAYVILKATDGTLTAYPTWYIIEPSGNSEDYVAISEVEYTYVNAMSGKTYEKGAVRYIEFPNTLTAVRNNGVFGNKNNAQCYEINVTDVYIPSSVKSLESAFNSAKSLTNVYIEAGNGITSIPSGTFSSSTVKYVQFENLTELESIDGFTKTTLTGDVDLSKTKLKTIANGAFQYSKNIGKITLPDTVEKIDDYAFSDTGSAYLASPYLPSSLTYVGQRFFAYNDNLLDTYIFPVGVKELKNEPFQDSKVAGGPSGKKLDLVFLGEVIGVVYLNGNGHQKHADEVTVYFAQNTRDQYNSNGFYIKPSGSSVTSVPKAIRAVFCKGTGSGTNGNVTGVEYIYITNTNGSAYTSDMVNDSENGFDFDGHTHLGSCVREENDCANDGREAISCIICDKEFITVLEATGEHNYVDGVCTVCGRSFCPSGADHSLKLEVVYANGFMSVGAIVNKCQISGCTYETKVEDLPALFTTLGYSVPENGSGEIAIGYTVDNEAIEKYESTTGTKITYGVFAVSKDRLGENDVFGESGAVSGAVCADVSRFNLTAFELKITGFKTDTQKSTKLAIGAYVKITSEGNVKYVYLQNSEAAQGEKYAFASYNDMLENL